MILTHHTRLAVLAFLLAVVIFLATRRCWRNAAAPIGKSAEGFSVGGKKFTLLSDDRVYDAFHAGAYDSVYDNPDRTEFECERILAETGYAGDPESAVLLDVGCGTGRTLARFRAQGVGGLFGLDRSQAMVDVATKRLAGEGEGEGEGAPCSVACGEATENRLRFPQSAFTHVTCLGGTTYELPDLAAFARQCRAWLQPGGVLVLHVVSQPEFSPELAMGRSQLEGAFRSVDRARRSVDVEGFTYRESYVVRGQKFLKEGWFTDKRSGHVRQTEQTLLGHRPEDIVRIAEEAGLAFRSRCSFAEIGDPFQFLYFFDRD